MGLLDEFAALHEIRTMPAATDRAKLAVAFWGDGAIERLVWQRVKIAYCRDDLDQETEEWIDHEIKEGRLSTGISAYGEWNEKIAPDDYVIDYEFDEAKPAYAGIWQALPAGIHPVSLRLVREIKWLPFHALGRFKVSAIERAALAGIAAAAVKKHSADGRNVLITIAQALALIDVRTKAANDNMFERAMLDIYDEATRFGYKPTMFRKMVADHGGLRRRVG